MDYPLDLKHTLLHTPHPNILLLILNRPSTRNSLTTSAQHELEKLILWYDKHPDLRCAIVTGAGSSFCAGGDLHEWHRLSQTTLGSVDILPRRGFAGLSRRLGRKPVIAAVNGPAVGGGFELLMGMDLIVAAETAVFALPEVKSGHLAYSGGLPRLMKNVGRVRAMQMALLGDAITAERACQWGLVNEIVKQGAGTEDVLKRPVVLRALEYAERIVKNSPDSVVLSRAGILLGHEHGSSEAASWLLRDLVDQGFDESPNFQEGVSAFVEKRKPVWRPSKL
ncbi:ClpP/crotonase-like domain-containing protein [Aspergillus floccosus]